MSDSKKVEGPTLYIQKMFPDVIDPIKKNPTDSGFDVYAHSFKKYYQNFGSNGERLNENEVLQNIVDKNLNSIELVYLDRVLIGTGIKATVGEGYEIQVRPRSGLALKQGLTVLNTPGTVDEGYRDEIGIILINLSRANQVVSLGERIAQLIVTPVSLPNIEMVEELPSKVDRGGGFGSTGSK
jgi:dUTP pyrophosphatase